MKLAIKINQVSINLHVCMFTLLLAGIDSSLSSKNIINSRREVYFCKFWSHKRLWLSFSSHCSLGDVWQRCIQDLLNCVHGLSLRKQRVSLPRQVGHIPVGVQMQGKGQVCHQVTNWHLQAPAPPASGTWRGIRQRSPVPPHLAAGCQHGPGLWEVLEKSLCEERGSAWPPALLSPRALRQREQASGGFPP